MGDRKFYPKCILLVSDVTHRLRNFKFGYYLFLLSGQSHEGDKVSALIHTYLHKALRKTEVTICNHQPDISLYVQHDV